jgi:mannitol-1-/sugar-/sorbitol-6-/2-deoxyglucose-6-phosphatase
MLIKSEQVGNKPYILPLKCMELNAVVFDMDGLLIDSEPLWQEAGIETLQPFGVTLTTHQYQVSTGLRTKEWVAYWFGQFGIDAGKAKASEEIIIRKAIEKINAKGRLMPGAEEILRFFSKRNFRIGLATSSPFALIDAVLEKFQLRSYFDALSSAEDLAHGKPHPEVYIDCMEQLGVGPLQALCFEDSFNGMIAAKAARMKCVVIPESSLYDHAKWGAADLKLGSLMHFSEPDLLQVSGALTR